MADIKQAAKWLKEGKKVTRSDSGWVDGYLVLKWNGLLLFTDPQGTDFGTDVISAEDILSDDWEVVNEK